MLDNLIHGGKSTTTYRSGTPALPLIVSTMKALDLIMPNIIADYLFIVNNLGSIVKQN